ncbi:MAG: glycoside hydrolase family 16 protein [Deltaproteobacteria bacterium]|nr:glycoside hydrolase family 16 protein [Deltaproteobacteria bacterium]
MKKHLSLILILIFSNCFIISCGDDATGNDKSSGTDPDTSLNQDSNSEINNDSETMDTNDTGTEDTDSNTGNDTDNETASGILGIIGLKENDHGAEYTSGRLNSNYNVPNVEGTWVRARAKMALKRCDAEDPYVNGTWPSVWLLGTDSGEPGYENQTDWPGCGEIDIIEWIGTHDDTNYQTNQWGEPVFPVDHNDPELVNYTSGPEHWHTYGVRFGADTITYTFDGEDQATKKYDDAEGQTSKIILNMALGGDMGGEIAGDFTQDILQVDWVRVTDKNGVLLWSDEMDDEQTTKDNWFPHVGFAYNNEAQYYTNWEEDNFKWHDDGTLGECQ